MKNSLEEKLMLSKAKAYMKKFESIESFDMVLSDESMCVWHAERLSKIRKIDIDLSAYQSSNNEKISCPINKFDFIKKIEKKCNVENKFSCSFFRNGVFISVRGECFSSFLKELFDINDTFDFSLMFFLPNRLIAANDNDHDVELFYFE